VRIRSKLLAIVLSATVAALLLAGAVLMLWDRERVRRELQNDLTATGALLAANSTAALAFDDEAAARDNLASLASQPHVIAGCLYTAADRVLFATYPEDLPADGPCPPVRPAIAPPGFRDGAAERWTPVVLDGRELGDLYLRSDLATLHARQRVQLWTLAAVLGVALGGGFLFALPLQRLVARPIRDLATTAQAVTRDGDYSLRVERQTEDEVGDLVSAFNRMLAEIETSDASIRQAKSELEAANAELRHEVTERQRAEREKARLLERERDARQEAEAANRLKDEFLATLSHELRTPLNAILGWVALLQEGRTEPEILSRAIGVIERNARTQAQLVDDLLDVSRVIAGKLSLDLRPVDLAAVLDAVADTVRPAAEGKRIDLSIEVEGDLPRFRADPARLQQMVWNLASNAVKFTPEGRSVRIAARRAGERIEIDVEDDGIGIDPEFLPHVFERFRQQDSSTTRSFGGLGLGLAIVRHLAELHGGEATAESDGNGKGALFRISLPLHEPGEESAAEEAGAATAALDNLSVLLVEDESDARDLYQAGLEKSGARVTAVATAAEALQALDDHRPDVMVSDIGLPGTDGYALLREVHRRAGGALPAIALTAYAAETDRRKSREAGFRLHLAKPVGVAELVRSVRRVVEESERS
jgi:signal transduction histidine kinase/ActR/RegA family two-component response regulator